MWTGIKGYKHIIYVFLGLQARTFIILHSYQWNGINVISMYAKFVHVIFLFSNEITHISVQIDTGIPIMIKENQCEHE